MAVLDSFWGVWVFDPAASVYPEGLPRPRAGIYTMLASGDDELWFHARWSVDDDPPQQVSFHARLGEAGHPVPEQAGLGMRTAIRDGALVTEVYDDDDETIHRATRSVDDDGLLVVQELRGVDGWVRSEARYRKTTTKQVLVYRRDLKMRKGKIAAQCAHASMAVFFRRKRGSGSVDELSVPLDGPMAEWVSARFTKICLSVDDEPALLRAYEAAQAAGLPCSLITDAGRTEFHGVPTRTAIAIGPAATPEVDAITGPNGLVPGKLA